VSPDAPERAPKSEGKASFELWHWKDSDLQSVQKINASRGQPGPYLAAWNVAAKKIVRITDDQIRQATINGDGRWALGLDDHPYRTLAVDVGPHVDADVYLINTLTGERRLILKKLYCRIEQRETLCLSPDGEYVLYFDGRDWQSMATRDGTTKNLTSSLTVKFYDEEYDDPDPPPACGSAGWTTHGKEVLLYDRYDVWQIAEDGSTARNLTQGAGKKNGIVFRCVRPEGELSAQFIDADQPLLLRAENELTHESGFYQTQSGSDAEPRKLAFEARKFSMPVKAQGADRYLLTASTYREFPDLLITDSEFRQFRKVSNANPQQKKFLWGGAELMSFTNSDGAALQGILYKPDNFDPHTKYPMIVYIYERMSDRFHNYIPPRPEWGHAINISYYVSNGYLVLAPDIAYSIGHPGQSALDCVLAAVAAVTKQGFVDENAIGIQGHSWGGYEVAYIVAHTDRFHAAEAGAVSPDMISGYDEIGLGSGTVWQAAYEYNQMRIGGSLWEYPDRFIDNSPIFAADRVKTPLLIVFNDADGNLPFSQGLELYLALRRLGKEVYLFNYNGEGHDLSGWANQKDFAGRMQDFFDYHLKGSTLPAWMERGIPYNDSH
jgi:acetyl esterase/lipase